MMLASLLLGIASSLAWDPMINPNLYEGDIVLSPDEWKHVDNGNLPYSSIGDPKRLWPGAEVPYEVDSSLRNNRWAMKMLKESLDEYHRYTCIRFIPRKWQVSRYVRFVDGRGCHSPLGYTPGKPNHISIGKGCWWKGKIIHEIGHTLGLHHEQTRPDRDDFVFVNKSNMRPESYERNFKKYSAQEIDSQGTPYDYLSLMHYRRTSFALNGKYFSIVTKDPKYQYHIGQSNGLSVIDAKQLNLMYQCLGSYPTPRQLRIVKGCYNTGVDCEQIAYKDQCIHGSLSDYAQRSCKMSCGLCAGGLDKHDGPMVTYVHSTKRPPVTVTKGVCKDTIGGCSGLISYCGKEGAFKKITIERCRKTCKYC